MRILATGFEPFGGDSVNASWEAVSRLGEKVGDHHIHTLRLPVVFGQCGERLLEEIRRLRPDAVVCCGVAGSRAEVTPELIAVNWRMGSIADNAGKKYDGERIDPAGPDGIMTALPANTMVAALKEAGLPARLSLSAGAYVCNDLYYALLQRGGCPGLFIHVPPLTVLDAEASARALALCIGEIA